MINKKDSALKKAQNPITGGEDGIRTHGRLLTVTAFPMLRLQPLGHLSERIIVYHISAVLSMV